MTDLGYAKLKSVIVLGEEVLMWDDNRGLAVFRVFYLGNLVFFC